MQVSAFCGLAGHYCHFIKSFTHLAHPLYDILGKEVKMGPVMLPPEAQEVVQLLKSKIQSAPVIVFPNFDKPFLLETDASKEGLGVVLSQKQEDGCYCPMAFGSWSLMPSEQNYHKSKLEFLALKWSITEHFKEYLAYIPFTVHTDNNLLMYVLTMQNLDVMGHLWVGALASYEFTLEYQKGTDNTATDPLSRVPVNQGYGYSMVAPRRGGHWHSREGRGIHKSDSAGGTHRLCDGVQVHALRLVPMHVTNWGEVQGEDT